VLSLLPSVHQKANQNRLASIDVVLEPRGTLAVSGELMSRLMVGILAAAGTIMSAIYGVVAHSRLAVLLLIGAALATGLVASWPYAQKKIPWVHLH
jgi:hypothetical protein